MNCRSFAPGSLFQGLVRSATALSGVARGAGSLAALSLVVLFLGVACPSTHAQTNEWTWMGGSTTVGHLGVYGTLGTPAAGNIPGGRYYDSNWTDRNGHFWLFGGFGIDATNNNAYLNDLWEFNPSTNEWAWISGSSVIGNNGGQSGVYGALGTPATGNVPGSRNGSSTWTDSSGNLWLFGGYGFDANGKIRQLNDLWEFDPTSNKWTWMGGNSTVPTIGVPHGVYGTIGTPTAGNIPGNRDSALSWTDSSGNFWLFGGEGIDAVGDWGFLNDLWKFNPSTNEWTWMGGSSTVPTSGLLPGIYGTQGTPAAGNVPGGRTNASSWTDLNGHFWLFGGYGYDSASNYATLNDLWEFNPSTNEWAWISGSSTVGLSGGQSGMYGTLGTPATGNVPGGRSTASTWTDRNGDLWLFGSYGYDSVGKQGYLNDLWEFNPATNEWAWMGGAERLLYNNGDYMGGPGTYGTLGTPAAGNIPGSRMNAANWTDSSGNFWLFGGTGYDSISHNGNLNDLWEYQPLAPIPAKITPTVTVTPSASISTAAQGLTVNVAVSGASGNPTPTGTVTLSGGGYSSTAQTLSSGIATFTIPANSLASGTTALTANYTGDSNYAPAMGIYTFGTPVIQSVSAVAAEQTQTITITGFGFGTQAGYTGTTNYIILWDVTEGNWSAGYGADGVTLVVSSWTDTSIVLQGFSGYYGYNGGYDLKNGDKLTLNVWDALVSRAGLINPTSGSSPGVCRNILVGGGATSCSWMPQTSAPVFSPAVGAYTTTQSVKLTSATAAATIYYTTNGTTPTISSSVYSGPITVTATETIEAIAVAAGKTESVVASATYTILQPQTITFPAITASEYAGTTLGLTASASSGLTVSFTSSTPTVCTVSGSTATLLASGTCSLEAVQAGNTLYAAATPVYHSLWVSHAGQTITFPAITGAHVAKTSVSLSAAASSGLAVSFTSSTPAVCTVTGSTASLLAGGACSIKAAQAGNSVYAAATSVSVSFTVSVVTQTITFPAITATENAATTLGLTATASSGLAVSYTSSTPAVCTVTGSTATLLASGTCSLEAMQAGNAAYSAATPVYHSFWVGHAPQTITFPAITATENTATTLGLTASASSGLTVSFSSSTPAVCTVTGSTATLLTSGTCSLQATQAGNTAYSAAAAVYHSFLVSHAPQVITFPAITASEYAVTTLGLTASASSGLAVSYTSSTPTVCTVTGSTAALLASGTCSLQATQAGNTAYSAAAAVYHSFWVSHAGQTITFPAITGAQVAKTSVSLNATASSGLAVSYTSLTPVVCTISGSSASLLASGVCSIQASQAGNTVYSAAANVRESFTVAVQ